MAISQGRRAIAASLCPLDRFSALQLVHLYAERVSPKYERAALRWLERYLIEDTPTLKRFARIAGDLAERKRELEAGGQFQRRPRTSCASMERPKPLSSSLPAGFVSTASSTAANVRGPISILPPSACVLSRNPHLNPSTEAGEALAGGAVARSDADDCLLDVDLMRLERCFFV
jgi:hypothetical protein